MIKFKNILLVGSTVAVSGPMDLDGATVRSFRILITQGERSAEGLIEESGLSATSTSWDATAQGDVLEPGFVTAIASVILIDERQTPPSLQSFTWVETKEAVLAPG
jgi:hypothetical protein